MALPANDAEDYTSSAVVKSCLAAGGDIILGKALIDLGLRLPHNIQNVVGGLVAQPGSDIDALMTGNPP